MGAKVKSEEDEAGALAFFIIIGCIPAAVIGLTFKDYFESLSNTVYNYMFSFTVTAIFLWSSKYPKENEQLNFMTVTQAILIGCAQALAIMPGISRSGATIVLALWLGMNKGLAARFSFLLSIPVVAGASLLEIVRVFKDGIDLPEGQWIGALPQVFQQRRFLVI